jgi:TfoX/Sxy family transcriptional regulator of competence genes
VPSPRYDVRVVDERLAQTLTWPDVSHRRMMGADCLLVDGSMFVILPSDETAAFKLPEPERERFLTIPGAGPFVVSRGPFGTWVQAPLTSLDDKALPEFARAAHEHVRALPKKRPRKRRRARP